MSSASSLAKALAKPSDSGSCKGPAPRLACPRCRRSLAPPETVSLKCDACDFVINLEDGIWRALPPERERYFQQFIREYEVVRQAEGRGSDNPGYYLSLPDRDLSGRLTWQWKIRARSYRSFERHVLRALEARHASGLDVLDIGAGNGWMSYRLALRGHRPVAVDLQINLLDGLGAAHHYLAVLPHPFLRFQSEMDHLPFADGQFDVALFNAALHYATDYHRTLSEALRCLRPDGHLIVLDSPVYQREESGLAMRNERHQQFARQYGFRSDSVPSREFLTFDILDELARELMLRWDIIHPWYGLLWALRPLKAKLQRRREPSRFLILHGTRMQAEPGGAR